MSVPENLSPTHSEKTLHAMKAMLAGKRITFDHTSGNPGEILYVSMPILNKNTVLVPGSLALRFDIDLNVQKFYTENNFGLLIDLRAMASQGMHAFTFKFKQPQCMPAPLVPSKPLHLCCLEFCM